MLDIDAILEEARGVHHRAFLVLSGSELWAQQKAEELFQRTWQQSLWIGARETQDQPSEQASKASGWLGRELDLIIFNAFSGFDVDAFGQLSGALRGGGLFVLLAPDLSVWSDYPDPEHQRLSVYPFEKEQVKGHYLSRLVSLISDDQRVSLISETGESRLQDWSHSLADHSSSLDTAFDSKSCRTQDQFDAVEAIIRVAKGHRRRPLVLTADRGRGKSAALGLAAAQLLESGLSHIVVTAPSMASADVVFNTAAEHLEHCLSQRGLLTWEEKVIEFVAPDELIHSAESISCDLMLVDEAAAIPVPLLSRLLKDHSRIVFSSTQHGYEGTGRGFSIKFKAVLDEVAPKWKALHLDQPIRWSGNDPFEAFVFRALMLDAQPVLDDIALRFDPAGCVFRKLNQDELVKNHIWLSDLFGLLVLAHYRTRPFDLRHLLDGPNIEPYCLISQGRVVATALLALEGGIEESLEEAIWLGKRRVRGHLLPQSMSNHAGFPEAIRYRGLRVIRIAVHPALQSRGVGSLLLERLEKEATSRGLDYLGSSFGATPELTEFWGKSGFIPVRGGVTREASSGCHSLMVLKPLTSEFSALAQEMSVRFVSGFLQQLPGVFKEMEPDLVRVLLRFAGSSFQVDLERRDVMDLESFVSSDRQYESCQSAIRSLLLSNMTQGYSDNTDSTDSVEAFNTLVAKVLQGKDWSELARANGLTGKKQAVQWLKNCVQIIMT
ncbi:tRNA(Met) cytidine acetyltransferase TmcA [Endozoicomonas arenosclerae]|uniref:tRNA(Met) cytidine acetyltransferase TmcA n=1 Tax=Endozoicomonas arenosclerae TaxID=1633495 RepID=UPI00078137E0|nr:GNAT family N-acetyltransferase [Endozoicomonas arenosclerae]